MPKRIKVSARGRSIKKKIKPQAPPMRSSENEEHDEKSEEDKPSSSSSEESIPPPEPKVMEKKSVKPVKVRQIFKIDDQKLEESILEWMQLEEHDFLWNSQRTEYRFPDKKKARFAEKEAAINLIHPELKLGDGFLSKWFEGLRDQYTKLHKRKSGDGAPQFTERQQWILDNLKFFQRLVTHRSRPVKSFKHTHAKNAGDLEAMERAAADEAIDVDDIERPDKAKRGKDKRYISLQEDTDLANIQKRIKDSDDMLFTLQSKLSAPLTEAAAFGSYIQATLGAMSKRKFRAARKAINSVLVPFLDDSDSSSGDDSLSTASNGLPRIVHSTSRRERDRFRPTATASTSTPLASRDSRLQSHPSQWKAFPAGQKPLDPWHSNPDLMHTYQTWQPQQQYVQQNNVNAQHQGWGQQLQPIHYDAPRPGPSQRQSLPILDPDQSAARRHAVSQAMSAVNLPLETSLPLDVSLNSSFNDSSFMKKYGCLPDTPNEREKTVAADGGDLNTPSPPTAKDKE